MENIVIRNIREEDIPTVVDIQIRGWQTAYKNIIDADYLNTMNREERIKKRKLDYKENDFIVAELDKEVVGFCRFIDNNKFTPEIPKIDCELIAIYVKPELKYSGIGTKLFQYVKETFKRKHKTKMVVWCLKDNEASKKFYEKMGGKIVKEKTAEIGNHNYIEVAFEYDI